QTARYDVPDMPTNRIDQGDFHTVQNDDTQPLAAQRQSAHNQSARERRADRREAQREAREQAREQERIDRARREVAAQGEPPQQFNRFIPPQVGNITSKINALPTPGGLAPLIAALLFFVFAIVPVGAQGSTRLELIWRVLTGGAYLPAEPGSKRAQIAEAQANAAASAEDVNIVVTAAERAAGLPDVGGIINQWWQG
ncbi:MAG: hypothetical protein ACXWQZ_24985, partial [Ktedonobacterales bacterium]